MFSLGLPPPHRRPVGSHSGRSWGCFGGSSEEIPWAARSGSKTTEGAPHSGLSTPSQGEPLTHAPVGSRSGPSLNRSPSLQPPSSVEPSPFSGQDTSADGSQSPLPTPYRQLWELGPPPGPPTWPNQACAPFVAERLETPHSLYSPPPPPFFGRLNVRGPLYDLIPQHCPFSSCVAGPSGAPL